jgi:hypothetical protein
VEDIIYVQDRVSVFCWGRAQDIREFGDQELYIFVGCYFPTERPIDRHIRFADTTADHIVGSK